MIKICSFESPSHSNYYVFNDRTKFVQIMWKRTCPRKLGRTCRNRKGKFFFWICLTSSSSADFNSSAENGAALKTVLQHLTLFHRNCFVRISHAVSFFAFKRDEQHSINLFKTSPVISCELDFVRKTVVFCFCSLIKLKGMSGNSQGFSGHSSTGCQRKFGPNNQGCIAFS